MPDENENTLPAIEENHREEQPLAIREDAVPVRSLAAEKVTDTLPAAAYERIGQIPALTPEQEKMLSDPLPDNEVDIRPDDGMVYASHEYYRRKLNEVFGRMQWTLVPGSPLTQRPGTNEWYQRWTLFVNGCYVSEAFESYDYQPNNARMDLSDVAEAIKSGALKRCCKDLGIAAECWQKRWTEAWRKKYAIQVVAQVWRKGQQVNAKVWRRSDADPLPGEQTSVRGAGANPQPNPQAAPAPAPSKPPETPPKAAAPAKPVQVVPDVPKAAPVAAPAQPATAPKPANTPKLLDSQIRMLFARGRSCGLVVGEDAAPMIEWLTANYGIAEVMSDGKKSTEICHAMFKMVPPVRFTALLKQLDELIKGAKSDEGAAEVI
jgi:Mitochondrial genome maintenance MGM101